VSRAGITPIATGGGKEHISGLGRKVRGKLREKDGAGEEGERDARAQDIAASTEHVSQEVDLIQGGSKRGDGEGKKKSVAPRTPEQKML